MTTEQIRVGGGDDWITLDLVERDHEAVGGLGNVSTCRVCKKGIVLVDNTVWRHVVAAKQPDKKGA